MKSPAFKFLLYVFILTLICGIGQWQWNLRAPAKLQVSSGFALLTMFAFITTAIHLFLLRSAQQGAVFVRYFLAATTFKFFIYLLILVALLLYSSDNKQALVLNFLIYYLAFTVFETSMIYTELNRKKGPH